MFVKLKSNMITLTDISIAILLFIIGYLTGQINAK